MSVVTRDCDVVGWRLVRRTVGTAVVAYAISAALVLIGVHIGISAREADRRIDVSEGFARFDGQHYRQIADEGYSYREDSASVVAFFPAYPLLGRAIGRATGMNSVAALLMASHLALGGACVAFLIYGEWRAVGPTSSSDLTRNRAATTWGLFAFSLFPSSFFFHMSYSESLFLFTSILSMGAIARNARLSYTAILVGLATAVRPVGVALIPPLIFHVWTRSETTWSFCRRAAFVTPVAAWGITAFSIFQYVEFGDAFAFARTQGWWRLRPDLGDWNKYAALAAWEPIWSVYDATSPAYWGRFGGENPWTSLQFWNPIIWVVFVALIVVAGLRRWLRVEETLLAAGLLAIPYVTRGFEMCMNSQARFAAVVFPAYIVLGQGLVRLPLWLRIAVLAGGGVLMAGCAAMFSSGQMYF